MSYDPDKLYNLLPAIHRIRDVEKGEPLRQLLALITQQVGILEEDLEQLYDNQFIETCAPWVLPYIGDLIGYRSLHPIGPEPIDAARGSGEHDRLPPAQRDGFGARATGARRHRLERARRRVFPTARMDAVHESHSPNELLRARSAAMGTARTVGHRFRNDRAHRRRQARRTWRREIQHPEHWDFPLATECVSAAQFAGCTGGRPSLSFQPPGHQHAALHPAADRKIDHASSGADQCARSRSAGACSTPR